MTTLVKTVPASELPTGWQKELGLSGADLVRVELHEIGRTAETEVERRTRLLELLRDFEPIKIATDSTEFIRAERDRLDGRGT